MTEIRGHSIARGYMSCLILKLCWMFGTCIFGCHCIPIQRLFMLKLLWAMGRAHMVVECIPLVTGVSNYIQLPGTHQGSHQE